MGWADDQGLFFCSDKTSVLILRGRNVPQAVDLLEEDVLVSVCCLVGGRWRVCELNSGAVQFCLIESAIAIRELDPLSSLKCVYGFVGREQSDAGSVVQPESTSGNSRCQMVLAFRVSCFSPAWCCTHFNSIITIHASSERGLSQPRK